MLQAFFKKQTFPDSLDVGEYTVRLRHNKRAKRYTLRFDVKQGDCVLTLPRRYSVEMAQQFLNKKQPWIKQQYHTNTWPHPKNTVLLHGQLYRFSWESGRGLCSEINHNSNIISLVCPKNRIARCAEKCLYDYAKKNILVVVDDLSTRHNIDYNDVRFKDTGSRWGSCSSKGNLNFSWRLIMAPPDVMNYVVAHELAHLKHLDHSPQFWDWCDKLSNDMKTGKRWMKENGSLLHAWIPKYCLDICNLIN